MDCGCEERKEYLNRIFEYKLKPRCLTNEEIQDYAEFVRSRTFEAKTESTAKGTFTNVEIMNLVNLHNSIFSTNILHPTCLSCNGTAKLLTTMVNRLDKVYLNNLPKPKQTRNKKEVTNG